MENEEEIKKLRAQLLELERGYKKLSLEESTKRLEPINIRVDQLVDAHRKNLDVVQASLKKEINTEQLREFTDTNRAVTRLQLKLYEVQSLIFAYHSPDVE